MDQAARRCVRATRAARLAACLLLLLACAAVQVWRSHSQLHAAAGSVQIAHRSGSSSPCSGLHTYVGSAGVTAAQPQHTHRRTAKMMAAEVAPEALGSSKCDPALPQQRICRIAVVGERHSGTNLAEQLLARNLDPARVAVRAGLTAHKHWMQPMPASPGELAHTLVVVPVRNPYDWATALHRVCYCCTRMERYGLPDFVRRPYAPDLFVRDAGSGLPCTSDVDTRRRTTFGSVMDMRTAKLRGLLDLGQELGVQVEVVRLEDLLLPEGQAAFVQRLVSKYGLPLAGRVEQTGSPEQSEQPQQEQQQQQQQQAGSGSVAADVRRVPAAGIPAEGQAEDFAAADHQLAAYEARDNARGEGADQHAAHQADYQAAYEAEGYSQDGRADEFAAYQAGQAGSQAAYQADRLSDRGPSDGAAGPPGSSHRAGTLVLHGIVTLNQADARWFISSSFSVSTRMANSIYLNEKRLVQYWQRLAPDIRAINSQLDWELEGQLGYHPLPTPQQAEAIALRGAAAAAWRAEHGFAAQGSTAYGRAVRGGMGHGGMVRRNGAAADDAQA